MTQFEFDKLIEKYIVGECSPDEQRLVEEWSERQSKMAVFPLSGKEQAETHKRLKKRVLAHSGKRWVLPFQLSIFRLAVAACFMGLVGFGAWFLFKNAPNTVRKDSFGEGGIRSREKADFELSNTTDSEQEFKLKDGSTITLKPQSKLTYLEDFGVQKRVVFLKGEGFFQIQHDTSKPFYVYAGDLVTKVMGTTFRVKAFDNTKAEVIVTSGKVLVYENKQGKVSNPIYLTPNQKVDYVAFQPTVLKPQLVDNPILVQPIIKVEDFKFKKTPLSTVINRLKTVYGIDIFLKNKALENCSFTGNLNELGLFEQLDLICKSIEVSYQKYETSIWIEGEGCP